MTGMEPFDFAAPAEVFTGMGRGVSRKQMTFKRFDTGAEAVQYAMEAVPPERMFGTVIESGDERYETGAIRALYERPDYPLPRTRRDPALEPPLSAAAKAQAAKAAGG